jgi:hypothetical protein
MHDLISLFAQYLMKPFFCIDFLFKYKYLSKNIFLSNKIFLFYAFLLSSSLFVWVKVRSHVYYMTHSIAKGKNLLTHLIIAKVFSVYYATTSLYERRNIAMTLIFYSFLQILSLS